MGAGLAEQMGVDFNSVDYLNGLIVDDVATLYDATVKEFTEFQKKNPRGRK